MKSKKHDPVVEEDAGSHMLLIREASGRLHAFPWSYCQHASGAANDSESWTVDLMWESALVRVVTTEALAEQIMIAAASGVLTQLNHCEPELVLNVILKEPSSTGDEYTNDEPPDEVRYRDER